MLPEGTVKVHDKRTWAIYYNRALNFSWLAWTVGNGWELTPLPGAYDVDYNVAGLRGYVEGRQQYACGQCDEV